MLHISICDDESIMVQEMEEIVTEYSCAVGSSAIIRFYNFLHI